MRKNEASYGDERRQTTRRVMHIGVVQLRSAHGGFLCVAPLSTKGAGKKAEHVLPQRGAQERFPLTQSEMLTRKRRPHEAPLACASGRNIPVGIYGLLDELDVVLTNFISYSGSILREAFLGPSPVSGSFYPVSALEDVSRTPCRRGLSLSLG